MMSLICTLYSFCIRKKGFYLVSRPVSGSDDPVTVRLFELDTNTPDGDDDDGVKINKSTL